MKKIKKIDWPMMLLAFGCAFILWLIVTTVTDPTVKKYFEIPVEYSNEDVLIEKGKSAEIQDETVSILVKAPRSVISTLTEGDFNAIADFTKIYQDNRLPVNVTLLTGNSSSCSIELMDTSVEVRIQNMVSVTLPINYVQTGTPAEGHVVGDISILPDRVTLTAPESFTSEVKTALVQIDVTDMKESFASSIKLMFCDASGAELNLSEQKDAYTDCGDVVSCDVRILSVQSMPISIRIGEDVRVDSGYKLTEMKVEPDTVTVCGEKDVISAMMGIEITDLPVDGARASIYKQLDIRTYLPEGVDIYEGSNMVSVSVEIEQLVERTYRVPVGNIQVEDVPDHYEYRFRDSEVTIMLRGVADDLNNLTEYDGQLSVSLKGLTVGEHLIPVNVILSSNDYEQVGTVSTVIEVFESKNGGQ